MSRAPLLERRPVYGRSPNRAAAAHGGVALALLLAVGCGRYGFGEDGDGGTGPLPFCPEIPGALVCSGFEGDFDDWLVEIQGQGSVTDVCPTPRTGQQCLVTRTDEGGAAARAWQPYRPIGSGMLYARVHAWIAPGVAIPGINLVALDARGSGVFGPDLNVVGDQQFQVYLEEGGIGGASVGPVPKGSWFCLHAAILVDDVAGSITAGYDDSSIGSEGIDTYPNGPYDMIAVGLDWTSDQQPPITVMIDDVVVATSPVPCQ